MPGRALKIMWLGDVHGPERDRRAVEIALRGHAYLKPDITIMLGDLLDNSAFSKHAVSTVRERTGLLENELAWANGFLDVLQKNTRRETVFVEGNHDAWVERYCADLPAGLAESVHSVLGVEPRLSAGRKNFRWIPYRVKPGARRRRNYHTLPGGVITVHGMSTAANAAAKHLALYKYQYSVVFGHTHRPDYMALQRPDGREVEALNPGCLCRLDPRYETKPTSWAHGVAVGYIGRASHTLYRCKIERGCMVMPDGKEIRA